MLDYASSFPPWGSANPDPGTVYQIPIDAISVPDLRVTSTFTEEQNEELRESLKSDGQKLPVELIWLDKRLILCDGLNRLVAMKHLGISTVKAIIREGNMRDVQISNVITARHRGRENPAQTAEVMQDLIENEKMDVNEVKRKLGLTEGTFKRLLAISRLPAEIKDHIKYNRLGVMAAFHITHLPDPLSQIELASQAVSWRYTEEQVKSRVLQIINPDSHPTATNYVFEPDGKPQFVLPKCAMCNIEVSTALFPVAHCEQCSEAYARFRQYYQTQLAQAATMPDSQSGP